MLKTIDREYSGKKIPIRTPRSTRNTSVEPLSQNLLSKKYLIQSMNSFFFRKCQECLQLRPLSREVSHLASSQEYLNRYYYFTDTCQRIKSLVTERVEKDYLFGVTFHSEWKVLEKYVHLQRNVKQRNLYNRYYFSNCPPKISQITQPTTATVLSIRAPQTNSTIELKVLTHSIDLMLDHQNSSKQFQTPERRMRKDKSEKKRKVKIYEEPPQESYGLISYKTQRKSKGRGSQSKGSKMHYCITPQPHCSARDYECRSPLPSHPRLSERVIKPKSTSKKHSSRSRGK